MARKSINRVVLINIVSTVIAQGLSFFTAPVFSRMLGPENYGVTAVYTSWINIVSVLFPIEASSTLVIARNEYPEIEQPAYQSSIMFLSLFSYTIFSLIVIALLKPLSKLIHLPAALILLMLFHGFGYYCVKFMNSKLTYEFKQEQNLMISLVIAVCSVALSLVLIPRFDTSINYWGRVLGLGVTYIIVGAAIFVHIWMKGRCVFSKDYWRFAIPIALPIILHTLTNTILSQSDRVMLQWFGSGEAAGIYSLAFSFAAVLAAIWNALNNSWVPFFYKFMREEKYDEIRLHAKNYIELFSVLTIGFVLLCEDVFQIYASKEYWSGTVYIFIFVLMHYMSLLYSFPVNFEFYHKKTKIIARGTILTTIINIILNLVFLKWLGTIGVAIASLMSMFFKFGFHFINVKCFVKCGTFPFTLKMLLSPLVIVVPIVILSYLLKNMVAVRLGCAVLIGVWEILQMKKRKMIF